MYMYYFILLKSLIHKQICSTTLLIKGLLHYDMTPVSCYGALCIITSINVFQQVSLVQQDPQVIVGRKVLRRRGESKGTRG